MCSRLVIVLCDIKVCTEAYVKKGKIFSGRPQELPRAFPVGNHKGK